VTLTLPDDVVAWLKTLHADPAWAIVKLHERSRQPARRPHPPAELAQLPGRRALILVEGDAFRDLPGVSAIPLADGRAFLALEEGRGVSELEIAVIDRIESPSVGADEQVVLQALRAKLREWRQAGLQFETRSIIVAHRDGSSRSSELSPLKSAERSRGRR
jgi:hypothetical protein